MNGMSALRDPTYSDLEVHLCHFVEGQPGTHPQISNTVDTREEKIVLNEHRPELEPDGDNLTHGSPCKQQIRERRCGVSRSKFRIILVLIIVFAIGAIVGLVVTTTQRETHRR
jgi:hypothetical protein